MTALEDLATQVVPGDGLVIRLADACFVVLPVGDAQRAFADQLVMSLQSNQFADGRSLIRLVVGGIASAEPADVAALGAVCAVDHAVVFLLHGAVEAVLTGSNGEQRFSGKDFVIWTEHMIDTAIERLDIFADAVPIGEPNALARSANGCCPGRRLLLDRTRRSRRDP